MFLIVQLQRAPLFPVRQGKGDRDQQAHDRGDRHDPLNTNRGDQDAHEDREDHAGDAGTDEQDT